MMNEKITDSWETTISFAYNEESVLIWSSDKTVWTIFDKLCMESENYSCKEVQKDRKGNIIAKVYILSDKSLMSFRKNHKKYTEEQKRVMADRLKSYRQ